MTIPWYAPWGNFCRTYPTGRPVDFRFERPRITENNNIILLILTLKFSGFVRPVPLVYRTTSSPINIHICMYINRVIWWFGLYDVPMQYDILLLRLYTYGGKMSVRPSDAVLTRLLNYNIVYKHYTREVVVVSVTSVSWRFYPSRSLYSNEMYTFDVFTPTLTI